MCGRYTLAPPDWSQLRVRFGVREQVQPRPRYNVAPGDDVLAVLRRGEAQPEEAMLRWGLVPHWASEPARIAVKTINARAETVAARPAYRDAFARKRCLILADGFYEWSAGTPHWITRADGAPFAFAGLWATWRPHDRDDVEALRSCAIVTTAAAGAIQALHDRMPVILEPGEERPWLDPSSTQERLHALLAPDGPRLVTRPVSRAVNDARHDAPDCLDPPEQTALF